MRNKAFPFGYGMIARKAFFAICILTAVLLPIHQNEANAYEIVQLTDNECDDHSLQLNDNGQAVWVQQCGDESSSEIMFFDGESVIQLTDDDERDLSPVINNQGRIAWEHGSAGFTPVVIYYYDGITIENASNGILASELGGINDSGVIVLREKTTESKIWLYDGVERTYFTEASENYTYRFISINNNGQLAWLRTHHDNLDIMDLFYYDGSDIIEFTETGPINWSPSLNNNGHMVWKAGEPYYSTNTDIFFYDGNTLTNLTNEIGLRGSYELNDSGQVVLVTYFANISDDSLTAEILLYQDSEWIRLTDDLVDDEAPNINNSGKIVWRRDTELDSKIMLYNGITTIQIEDNAYSHAYPKIGNDDSIAWQGFDGQDPEIFMASFVTLPIWAQTYGGINDDYASVVVQTMDGGYIVSGNTASFGAGSNDLWVIKLDESGTVQWEKSYGGTESDYGPSIRQTSADGSYILAGQTESFGAGIRDVWVLKLDASGDVLWEKTFGGDAADGVSSIEELPSGGYIFAGRTGSFGAGTTGDLWVVKLDSDGNIIWEKTYGTGEGGEYATSLQPTDDGGCAVAGTTFSSGAGNEDFWVLRLDEDGSIVWQKTYGGTDIDISNSIRKTGDGGFIVAGNTYSFPISVEGYDVLLLKLNADGDIQWQKNFGTVGWDDVSAVEMSWDGGFFLTGSTGLPDPLGPRDGWIMKMSPTGEIVWQKKIGGLDSNAIDTLSSLHRTYDGGVVVVGSTDSFGIGSRDAWVLKLDSGGKISDCPSLQDWSAASSNTSVTVSISSGVSNDTTATETSTSAIVGATTLFQTNGCSGVADLIDLPSTGQTSSYYPGDDGYFSSYGVSWPVPRFVDNGDGTISDTLTGLMWLKDGNVARTIGHDPNETGDGSMYWESALDFVAGINDATYDISSGTSYTATYTDWRVPNINELESLANWGEIEHSSWLNGEGFDNIQPEAYWSSSTNSMYNYFAWYMGMSNGHINYGHKESSSVTAASNHVLPVRAGQQNHPDSNYPANVWKTGQTGTFYPGDDGDLQMGIAWPSQRFFANGDGTVSDSLTGLMWLQDGGCLGYQNTWESAHDTVADFNENPGSYDCEMYTATYTDWRMPNRKEAYSVIDYSQTSQSPGIWPDHPFTNLISGYYRTSTTYAPGDSWAWSINIGYGSMSYQYKTGDIHLWAVRGGKAEDSDDDGLIDSIENAVFIDPHDADTDDDGISDGEEDADQDGIMDAGETDPRNADTDGDGIQDGTELGITTGHPTDTSGTFIPDADGGATTTDPLDSDSDNDGLLDGEEDTNHNGKVDEGETDPNQSDTINAMPWLMLLLDD